MVLHTDAVSANNAVNMLVGKASGAWEHACVRRTVFWFVSLSLSKRHFDTSAARRHALSRRQAGTEQGRRLPRTVSFASHHGADTPCAPALHADLEWKLIYVGSAESEDFDQVLDSVLVGPVYPGQYRFVFQVWIVDVLTPSQLRGKCAD